MNFDVCALEDVEENKNDANTNTLNNITIVPASGSTKEIMMKQCEEIMTKLKEPVKQRNEKPEQSGSSSSGERDGCSQTQATLMTGSRKAGGPEPRDDAGVQTMATKETGAVPDKRGWCFVEESISPVIKELLEDKSSEVSNEENMLAVVTDDQERVDVEVHTQF